MCSKQCMKRQYHLNNMNCVYVCECMRGEIYVVMCVREIIGLRRAIVCSHSIDISLTAELVFMLIRNSLRWSLH